jgi:hypothetical protein
MRRTGSLLPTAATPWTAGPSVAVPRASTTNRTIDAPPSHPIASKLIVEGRTRSSRRRSTQARTAMPTCHLPPQFHSEAGSYKAAGAHQCSGSGPQTTGSSPLGAHRTMDIARPRPGSRSRFVMALAVSGRAPRGRRRRRVVFRRQGHHARWQPGGDYMAGAGPQARAGVPHRGSRSRGLAARWDGKRLLPTAWTTP